MTQNLIFNKFQKYNKNTFIKFINYKIQVIGPLGILEKLIIKNNNNKIYYLLLLINKKYQNNLIISEKLLKSLFDILNKLIIGVNYGWYFLFNITGRGFTFKLKKKNNLFFLKLKIGYSHYIYYNINKKIMIKISKKKNKLFFFSLHYWLLTKMVYQLRNLRSKHIYKIQGIQFFDEKIVVKPGKKKQV